MTQFQEALQEDKSSSGVYHDGDTSRNNSFCSFSDQAEPSAKELGSLVKCESEENDLIESSEDESPVIRNRPGGTVS